jgi:type IV pilus assembly protein PilA
MTFQNISANKIQKGFSLIELLVVIGILAVLLAITLIAINPARQFAQANDTKRRSNVTQILNAIGAYHADNRGNYPAAITATATEVGRDVVDPDGDPTNGDANTLIDLCDDLLPEYMPAIPRDPRLSSDATGLGEDVIETECTDSSADLWTTGYRVINTAGRITIDADSEVDPAATYDITVTR